MDTAATRIERDRRRVSGVRTVTEDIVTIEDASHPLPYEAALEGVSIADEEAKRVIRRSVADLPLFDRRQFKSSTALSTSTDESFTYWRYSTDKQLETSEERQIAVVEGYLAQRHPSKNTVFGDRGKSGVAMMNRPGLQLLRAEARRLRPKRLVVEDLDRLSRRLADLLVLHAEFSVLGIEIHDVTHGRLDLVHIMIRGYMGEEGRVRFLGLGKSGRRQAVAAGRMMQIVAYGYRKHPEDGTVHLIDELTCAVVTEIFEWAASGVVPHAIARILTRRGTPPPRQACVERRGGKVAKLKVWHAQTVRDILRSYLYMGFVCWAMTESVRDPATNSIVGTTASTHGEQVVVHMPELAFVDPDLWTRANMRLLMVNTAATSRHGDRYLFTGKAVCACCGEPFTGSAVQGFARYACTTRLGRGPDACPGVATVRIDWLERAVIERIFVEAFDLPAIETYQVRVRELVPLCLAADARRRGEILRRLERIDDLITRIYEDERAGIISKARAEALRRGHGKEGDLLDREMGKLRHESQYMLGIDALDLLRKGCDRVLDELPFRPRDAEGIALAQSLAGVVASIVVHQPDAAGAVRVEIVVDPFLALRDGRLLDGMEAATGTIPLETSFDPRKLVKATFADRMAERRARADLAAKERVHAICDADWAVAAPFLRDADFVLDGAPAPRTLIDGILCTGAVGDFTSHVPTVFGDANAFRRAVRKLIASGRFDRAVEALVEAGAGDRIDVSYYEGGSFPRRAERTERPTAERAACDRAILLAAAGGSTVTERVRLRCNVVASVLEGRSIASVARDLGIKRRAAYFYWDRYMRGGVAVLAPTVDLDTPDARQRLDAVQVEDLRRIAMTGVDPEHGDRPITAKRLVGVAEAMCGKAYSVAGLRQLMRRYGFTLGAWVRQARREGRLAAMSGGVRHPCTGTEGMSTSVGSGTTETEAARGSGLTRDAHRTQLRPAASAAAERAVA